MNTDIDVITDEAGDVYVYMPVGMVAERGSDGEPLRKRAIYERVSEAEYERRMTKLGSRASQFFKDRGIEEVRGLREENKTYKC